MKARAGLKHKLGRLRLIGLTGSPGSGKTTVARFFKRLGAQVIDCDKLAHAALRRGTRSYRAVRKQFGQWGICNRDGTIHRRRLGEVIFTSLRERQRLERIVHPYVLRRIRAALKQLSPPVILDIPLLFETGFHRHVDAVIVVTCTRAQQMARLRRRDGLTRQAALARLKAQWPLARKVHRSDFIINNSNGLQRTHSATRHVWRTIKENA